MTNHPHLMQHEYCPGELLIDDAANSGKWVVSERERNDRGLRAQDFQQILDQMLWRRVLMRQACAYPDVLSTT